jgi:hypothetical protein
LSRFAIDVEQPSRHENRRIVEREPGSGSVRGGRVDQHDARRRNPGSDRHFLDDVDDLQLFEHVGSRRTRVKAMEDAARAGMTEHHPNPQPDGEHEDRSGQHQRGDQQRPGNRGASSTQRVPAVRNRPRDLLQRGPDTLGNRRDEIDGMDDDQRQPEQQGGNQDAERQP